MESYGRAAARGKENPSGARSGICLSPQYLAEELLRLEGFTDIAYVAQPMTKSIGPLEAGQADMTQGAAVDVVAALDAGRAVLSLAGIHAGCYELFVNGNIGGIKDLKGKSVAITTDDSTERLFLWSIVAYIDIDPRHIRWIKAASASDALQTFVDGKADAFFAFAPQGEELRAKTVGRVILNTTYDRPWSQYFCCAVSARREFAQTYPVATRRALRAFLKAVDLCAQEPERAARYLAVNRYEPRYDMALAILRTCLIADGVMPTPRTLYASMLCGCTKSASSSRARRSSSPRAPIGAFSTMSRKN